MNNTSASTGAPGSSAAKWAGRLLIAGVVLTVLSWLLSRPGLLGPFPTMMGYTLGSLLLIITGILAIVSLVRGKDSGAAKPMTWAALAGGTLCIINTLMYMGSAGGSAPIHDISTDTTNPPQFDAVIALRGDGANPPEYSGPEAAALQAEAYPDIQTVVLRDPADFVFESAVTVSEEMGWEIVAQDIDTGHIEATATTPFVGFKDDVVIRVRANGPETMVDVRSKSRIGGGDAGVNAKRIRKYSARLVEFVEP
ncbi:MAG: DUF1499 domain-containing protein [Gammaproteobacteria bacterium]